MPGDPSESGGNSMAGYPNLDEMDELYPDEGYNVIIEDQWKPPDSDDFVNVLGHFETAKEVTLPAEKENYDYMVFGSDDERWSRSQWETYVEHETEG